MDNCQLYVIYNDHASEVLSSYHRYFSLSIKMPDHKWSGKFIL